MTKNHLTEFQVQNRLFTYLYWKLHHRYVVPNIKNIFYWECDVLSVTDALFVKEFEIKVTRADFINDIKTKPMKHFKLANYNKINYCKIPSQFWYVINGFEIDITTELPTYAGLITVATDGRRKLTVVKKAPRISDYKITEENRQAINTALCYRFWEQRIRLNGRNK